LDRDALALGLEFDLVKDVRGILRLGDVDALDRASSRSKEFQDRVTSFDLLTTKTFLVARRRATWSAYLTADEWTSTLSSGTALRDATARCRSRTHDTSSSKTTALAPIPS
jgi:hypothetical protein